MGAAVKTVPEPVPGSVKRRNFNPIQVVVVDDSLVTRTALSRTIGAEPDMHIAGTANSAEQALALLDQLKVDVILLDLEMPGIGGLAALPQILVRSKGAQVLIVSALTAEGAEHTLEALAMGAADTMLKPEAGKFDRDYRQDLLDRVRALGRNSTEEVARQPEKAPPRAATRVKPDKPARVLAIAGSTGGIHALCSMLQALPERLGLPILVTQHLPVSFIPVFARQLEIASSRPAHVANEGTVLQPDRILIAPGDGHLGVVKKSDRFVTTIEHGAMPSGCMPSADPMFASLATAFGAHGLGVVLSGMGTDGLRGASELADAGGKLIAQDRTTASVWGMPRAIVQAGLACAILPPERIAAKIIANVDHTAWK